MIALAPRVADMTRQTLTGLSRLLADPTLAPAVRDALRAHQSQCQTVLHVGGGW